MDGLIIVFTVFAIIMGAFCVFVVAQDIYKSFIEKYRKHKEKKEAKEKAEKEAQQEIVEELVVNKPEEKVEELTIEESEERVEELVVEEKKTEETEDSFPKELEKKENSGNTVAFATTIKTMTHEEKYLELSAEYKKYYDEIVRYSIGIEESKRIKNASSEEYKIGRNSIVKMKIKRGIIVCELVIPNMNLKNYASDNKINVKQAPTTIKVVDEASLSAVKYSIDIIVKAINDEKEYKKEQAKLKRKKNDTVVKEEKAAVAS